MGTRYAHHPQSSKHPDSTLGIHWNASTTTDQKQWLPEWVISVKTRHGAAIYFRKRHCQNENAGFLLPWWRWISRCWVWEATCKVPRARMHSLSFKLMLSCTTRTTWTRLVSGRSSLLGFCRVNALKFPSLDCEQFDLYYKPHIKN